MEECVEYKKLMELRDKLKWFRGSINGIDITDLEKSIDKRIDEIPEVSRIFSRLPHGQTS